MIDLCVTLAIGVISSVLIVMLLCIEEDNDEQN